MFYIPYELRETKGKVVPKGPSFSRAGKVELNLAGTKIRIRMPPHRPDPRAREGYPSRYQKGYLDLAGADFNLPESISTLWRCGVPLKRSWRFCGPWFTGVKGQIHFTLAVLQRDLEHGETLFNPRVFESELDAFLTRDYSDEKSYGACDWQSPANWKVVIRSPVTAVAYDSLNILGAANVVKALSFPIADNCLVQLDFRIDQLTWTGGNLAKVDKQVDRQPMEQLVTDICNSLEIELSETAQQQLAEAQRRFPNEKISEHREPLNWMTPEDEELYARYLKNPELF
ncbi:hypothetical protein [Parendozoicomonas sp. Alg238-R29]|uniref:hypothetical protein n=1 Tax=Parendozoicomonas sp. Alg238-R29 TaxID=2993446 RepID=UPI00248D701E|nr:hypothetical protein [Parendozoicomonas sp. Alg238-R29]